MHRKILSSLHKLSSKRALMRKQAIKELRPHLPHDHMARISLHYISEHDPNCTVRTLARRAFYDIAQIPSEAVAWDKTYSF